MKTVHSINATRAAVAELRARHQQHAQPIALVPTMGNLHDGHLRLVQEARKHHAAVAVSIFVNPLQFGPGEDFGSYPRTLEADTQALAGVDADLIFAPSVSDMYPGGQENHVEVRLPALANLLCGEHRPGHFDGVGTVVLKLFNIIQPDAAYFGEKDFQQLQLLRIITRQLDVPVEVKGVPTVRAEDGLALSSRNQYLSADERTIAPLLHATLRGIAGAIAGGNTDYPELQEAAMAELADAGFDPDYIEVRDADTLKAPDTNTKTLRILAAARLGGARLIDNIGAHIS